LRLLDFTAPYQSDLVYFDSLTVTATNIPVTGNTASGELWESGI
jgi:hypothetical protein